MARRKERLDRLLVSRGLLPDERTAQAWIIAGKVVVGGEVRTKAGTPVDAEAEIALRGVVERYVSRGGYKLEAALARFALDVRGKVVLDAGASTGGFTDCLLQHGAARVYACDVGYGQLRGKLAADPRVVNLERTNVSELVRAELQPPIELAVFDLSYLSFVKAVPIVAALFTGPGEIVGLFKPLFEGVADAEKDDLVAIEAALSAALPAVTDGERAVLGLVPSPILGSHGTVELLVHLGPPRAGGAGVQALVAAAMAEARLNIPKAGASV